MPREGWCTGMERDRTSIIVRLVRGEASLDASIGLGVRRTSTGWLFEETAEDPVLVTGADIAAGFIATRSAPETRRTWSSFLLAAAGLVSLERLHDTPKGELLLDALWDSSQGLEPSSAAWAAIATLSANAR